MTMDAESSTIPSVAAADRDAAWMRAIVISDFGAPAFLRSQRVPVPVHGAGEVLVRVDAVALSRFLDVLARHGRVPDHEIRLPHIPGGACSGQVEAMGDGVEGLAIGDRVAVDPVIRGDGGVELLGLHRPGAYADLVVAPASCVHSLPGSVGAVDAAALALSGPAAAALLRVARIGQGSRVLVQGAGSGLGCTAALLARFAGAAVAVATPREDQLSELRGLGFEHVYHSLGADAAQQVRADSPDGFDVVVHNMGAPKVWDLSFVAVRDGGTIVLTGLYGGVGVRLDLKQVMARDLRVVGVSGAEPADHVRLWAAAAKGFRTQVAQTWPLDEAATAHRLLEEGGQPVGRIVLAASPEPLGAGADDRLDNGQQPTE